jgi:preprotein translocase subunit YajC
MSFFISDAYAAAQSAAEPVAGQADSFSFVMIAAIFVLGYFMLIRPQNKKAKEHRDLITKLKKGDEVVTAGGIIAKVVDLGEQYVKLSPSEGVELYFQKSAVTTVLPKGTMKSL